MFIKPDMISLEAYKSGVNNFITFYTVVRT